MTNAMHVMVTVARLFEKLRDERPCHLQVGQYIVTKYLQLSVQNMWADTWDRLVSMTCSICRNMKLHIP